MSTYAQRSLYDYTRNHSILNYSHLGDSKNTGIDIQGRFDMGKNFRFSPGLVYFFPKNNTRFYAANANISYVIPLINRISIAPLVGVGASLSYHKDAVDRNSSQNEESVMVNAGLAAEVGITNRLFLNAECKYMLDICHKNNEEFPVINAGIGYRF